MPFHPRSDSPGLVQDPEVPQQFHRLDVLCKSCGFCAQCSVFQVLPARPMTTAPRLVLCDNAVRCPLIQIPHVFPGCLTLRLRQSARTMIAFSRRPSSLWVFLTAACQTVVTMPKTRTASFCLYGSKDKHARHALRQRNCCACKPPLPLDSSAASCHIPDFACLSLEPNKHKLAKRIFGIVTTVLQAAVSMSVCYCCRPSIAVLRLRRHEARPRHHHLSGFFRVHSHCAASAFQAQE
jgi:hypothetical protein